ncbi:hypothetical protein Y032_0003g1418 [Ancylostoma ceylanicum]|uniref:Uncharacterized protein n=1 Tax=Ancylostoma ceylanicum TaxID=53326 RepID=A0A016VX18_9BILA|nr:hypothetical protein Y032_0003g1418 [Ancylostoma ceylanicum]
MFGLSPAAGACAPRFQASLRDTGLPQLGIAPLRLMTVKCDEARLFMRFRGMEQNLTRACEERRTVARGDLATVKWNEEESHEVATPLIEAN